MGGEFHEPISEKEGIKSNQRGRGIATNTTEVGEEIGSDRT